MKKTLLVLSTLFVLFSCGKETTIDNATIDASRIVFDIAVNRVDTPDVKGVKSDWTNGDKIYLFFEDNTEAYAYMTFNGTSWQTTVSGSLSVSATGKKLSAVYVPFNTDAPTYSSGWKFTEKYAVFMKDAAVAYTVTLGSIPATLSTTLNMAPLERMVQFFIADATPVAGKYALTISGVTPVSCGTITPGGAIATTSKTAGYAIPGMATTLGGEPGYYFWGVLEAGKYNVASNYDLQLVEQEPTKGYALNSMTKPFTGKTLGNTSSAVKLSMDSGWTDEGPFVDLGFGSVKWATGNLIDGSPYIAAPNIEGTKFEWGYTTPYSGSPEAPKADSNFEDAATAKNSSWHIPSKTEVDALTSDSNTSVEWKAGWTDIGTDPNKGGLLVTSKNNGISILMAPSTGSSGDGRGWYWTSTPAESNRAYFLFLDKSGNFYTAQDASNLRIEGYQLRPVK